MDTLKLILSAFLPLFFDILTLLAPIVAGILAKKIINLLHMQSERERVEKEAQMRDLLHAAIENGVALARKRSMLASTTISGLIDGANIADQALAYVKTTNAGTIKQLGVSDAVLRDLVALKS